MGIWLLKLCSDLLFPAVMLIVGRLFMVRPPAKISSIVGYRTAMSMKNEDTWEFAHHYAGRLWWKWSKLMLPVALIPMLLVIGRSADIIEMTGSIFMCLQMIPMIGVLKPTERALRKTFGNL